MSIELCWKDRLVKMEYKLQKLASGPPQRAGMSEREQRSDPGDDGASGLGSVDVISIIDVDTLSDGTAFDLAKPEEAAPAEKDDVIDLTGPEDLMDNYLDGLATSTALGTEDPAAQQASSPDPFTASLRTVRAKAPSNREQSASVKKPLPPTPETCAPVTVSGEEGPRRKRLRILSRPLEPVGGGQERRSPRTYALRF